jgi:hypothetical protein
MLQISPSSIPFVALSPSCSIHQAEVEKITHTENFDSEHEKFTRRKFRENFGLTYRGRIGYMSPL